MKTLVKKLTRKKLKISFAESCTGGMLANTITSISGASKVFNLGLITYSNQAKIKVLKVNKNVIKRFGAVSHECCKAMVVNLSKISKANINVSITGIAGPGGGCEGKPVGTVYISLASKLHETLVVKKHYQTSRLLFKEKVSMYALNLVRESLLSS